MSAARTLTEFRALNHAERIDALIEIQRRRASLDAEEQRLLAVIDTDPTADPEHRQIVLGKGFVREEVACALRVAFGTAQTRLHVARSLVDRFPDALDALETGALTYLHCRCLVELTKDLDSDLAGHVQDRVLPPAGAQTVGEFRRAVSRAVLLLDPADQADRHRRAAADRRVQAYPGPDGMTTIWAQLPDSGAEIVMTSLNTLAGRVDPSDERTMDQRRADILIDICADALDRLGGTQHGRKPAVQITIALSTLLGLDHQPGELAGHGPIPAELAREIAFDPTGTWRRLVTDEHGHLLELGTTAYQPPQPLADHVIARDQTCRAPGCNRRARTCELDHIRPWPLGPTEAANLHALCSRHHHWKHEAGWRVRRIADGTTTWTSATGHQYDKRPWTYPVDHTLDRPTCPDASAASGSMKRAGSAAAPC